MDDPGNDTPPPERDSLERLFALLGPRFDEARSLFDDATGRWRGDLTNPEDHLKLSKGLQARWYGQGLAFGRGPALLLPSDPSTPPCTPVTSENDT